MNEGVRRGHWPGWVAAIPSLDDIAVIQLRHPWLEQSLHKITASFYCDAQTQINSHELTADYPTLFPAKGYGLAVTGAW